MKRKLEISIEWMDHEKCWGRARVISPCCDRTGGDNFTFNVWVDNGVLIAGFYEADEDARGIPLRFCPSCGSKVKVVQEVILPPQQYGTIISGEVTIKKGSND